MGIDEDCNDCPQGLQLDPANLTALEIWKALHTGRVLSETLTWSYRDMLATIGAYDGSRQDIERVISIEAIWRKHNGDLFGRTRNRYNSNNKGANRRRK